MATEKQIAANRLNAQKSTGPRTREGRAASRLNSLKHGLTAETLILPGENASDLEALLDAFESKFRPTDEVEQDLVRQMALATWRLRRFSQVENALWDFNMRSAAEYRDKRYPGLSNAEKMAYQCQNVTHMAALDRLTRYQARISREYRNALNDLLKLRKQMPPAQEVEVAEEVPAESTTDPAPKIGFVSPKIEQEPPAARKQTPCHGGAHENGRNRSHHHRDADQMRQLGTEFRVLFFILGQIVAQRMSWPGNHVQQE